MITLTKKEAQALQYAREYLEHNKKFGITTVPQDYLRKRLRCKKQWISYLRLRLRFKKKIWAAGRGVTHWTLLEDDNSDRGDKCAGEKS